MDDTNNKINKKSKVKATAKLSSANFDSKKKINNNNEDGIDPLSENLSLLRTLIKNNFKYIKAQNTLLRKDIATLNLSLKNIVDKLSSFEEMGFDNKTDNKSSPKRSFFSFKDKSSEKKTKEKDKPKSSSKPSSFSSSKDSFDNPIFDRLRSKLFKEIEDLDFLLKSVRFLFGGVLAGGTLFNKSKKDNNGFDEGSSGKKAATFAESPIDWEKTNFANFFPLIKHIKDGLFFSNTVPYLALLDENMLWVSSELRVATTLLGNMEKLTKEELNEIRKSNRKTVLRRRKPLSDDEKVPEKKPMIYFKKRVSLADAGSTVADNVSDVSQMNKFTKFIGPMLGALPFILIALPAFLFFAKQAYRTFYKEGKSINEVTGKGGNKKKENIYETYKYGMGKLFDSNTNTEKNPNGLIKRNKIEKKKILFDADGKYIEQEYEKPDIKMKSSLFDTNRQKPNAKKLGDSSKVKAVNMLDNKDFKSYKNFIEPKYAIDEYNNNLKIMEARSYADSSNAGVGNIIAPITNVNNNQYITGGLKIRSQDGARLSGISSHITP